MSLKETYNRIANDWFKDHNDDTWWVEGTEKLTSLLSSNASILDIGCGAGHKSNYLARKGFKVTGTDFSEEMIKIAQREVPTAKFKILDLYDIDTAREIFDCVFAQAVFLHIPKEDVVGILKKAKKVLKSGGLFYIAVKELREGEPDEKIEIENDYGYEYKRFFSYFTLPELESYFAQAGYVIVHSMVTPIGKTRWLQVIAKN